MLFFGLKKDRYLLHHPYPDFLVFSYLCLGCRSDGLVCDEIVELGDFNGWLNLTNSSSSNQSAVLSSAADVLIRIKPGKVADTNYFEYLPDPGSPFKFFSLT